jgi:hypothetical protein
MRASSKSSFPLALIVVEAVLVVACAALIVYGALHVEKNPGLGMMIAGILGLIVVGATVPLMWMLSTVIKRSDGSDRRTSGPISAGQSAEQLLAQIYENSMLSDNAKRVLFRDRELELLRRAIEEDIAHGDYNSGLTLCDEMGSLFGHLEEAEAFRNRILQAGHAQYEARVHQALEQFERILASRDWAQAYREAASIRRLYPNHHMIQDLDQRSLRAREEHKRELETQLIDAASRDDVDAAMPLLKELDRYLTRDEAQRLSEVAQAVVMKHRENLSMQFKLAVNDHRWAEAAQVGDRIIAEYPNTKMADEVRSMIDVLRVRATQAAVLAQEA